jgi:hypothetical protein
MKNVLEYSERCGEPVEGTLEIPKSSTWYAELGFHTWRRVGVAGSRRSRWGSAEDGGHAHVAPGERMGPRAHRQARRAGVTGSRRGRWGSAADSGHAHAAPGEADGAARAQAGTWSGSSEGDGGAGVGDERSRKNRRREEARCCPFLGRLLCCAVLRCPVWGLEKKQRSKLLCCRLLLELEAREERSKGLLPEDLPSVGTEWDKAQLCFRWTSPNCALGELWGIGLVCCGFRLSRI